MELEEIEAIIEKLRHRQFTLSAIELARELKKQIEKTDEMKSVIERLYHNGKMTNAYGVACRDARRILEE